MKKIFVFVQQKWNTGDIVCAALCEDGTGLCSHLSSNETWAKIDMGVTSNQKHDIYSKHCPDGFQVEWIEGDPTQHEELMNAYRKNQEICG